MTTPAQPPVPLSDGIAFDSDPAVSALLAHLGNIRDAYEMRTELFTSDADLAANLADRANKALAEFYNIRRERRVRPMADDALPVERINAIEATAKLLDSSGRRHMEVSIAELLNALTELRQRRAAETVAGTDRDKAMAWLQRRVPDTVEDLERLFASVRADEREKCAKVADDWKGEAWRLPAATPQGFEEGFQAACGTVAAALRRRQE